MRERLKKKGRRILKKLTFILFILLLILYLIGSLQQQRMEIDFLMNRVTYQQNKIDKQELDIARLEKAFSYSYSQVQELKKEPKVIHNEQPKQQQEVEPKFEPVDLTTTIIVGALTLVKSVFSLSPAY